MLSSTGEADRRAAARRMDKAGHRICIVFTDITRATPERSSDSLASGVFGRRSQVFRSRCSTARHSSRRIRARSLEQLLTPAVVRDYRVLNHEPENPSRWSSSGNDSRRNARSAQSPLGRGRCSDHHRFHRTPFLRRLQRRTQRHHAGRGRTGDRHEQSWRQTNCRSRRPRSASLRAIQSGRKCATSPCAPGPSFLLNVCLERATADYRCVCRRPARGPQGRL